MKTLPADGRGTRIGVDAARAGDFIRHRGPVTGSASIPGTSWVATSGYDGAVARFNLDTGDVELIGYHDHLVNQVSVSADGAVLASCSSDYTVGLWSIATGATLMRLVGHDDDVEAFTFLGNSLGASASRDKTIIVWDLRDGSVLGRLRGHDADVLSITFLDGLLYTSGDDMTLRAWDLESGEMKQLWGPFENETDTCSIDPIHSRAVLGCDDGRIRVFDLKTGALASEIPAHASGIKKVAVSPRTGDILSAAYDQRLCIWEAAGLTKSRELSHVASTWERSLSWSPDGSRVLGGSFDGTVLAWEVDSGELCREVGADGYLGNACLNDLSASANGLFVSAADDGRVRLARATGTAIEPVLTVEPDGPRTLMNAIALDKELGLIVAGAHNHSLHFYQLEHGGLRERQCLSLGQGPINSVRIATHADFRGDVFAACYSGLIRRVGVDGHCKGNISVHEGAVKSLRLHPALPAGVSCGADGLLVGWTIDGDLTRRYTGHTAIINDVDLSPNGDRLCSVSRDFTLRVYGVESGCQEFCFELGNRSLKSVCFFDDGQILVGDYWGHLIRVDLVTGATSTRRIARNGISSLSKSGDRVIAASYDGSLHAVRPGDLRVMATLAIMVQHLDAFVS